MLTIERRDTNAEALLKEFRQQMEECSVLFLCRHENNIFVSPLWFGVHCNESEKNCSEGCVYVDPLKNMGIVLVNELDEIYVIRELPNQPPPSLDMGVQTIRICG